MEIDHIVPRGEGGASTVDNAIAVCFDCHAEIHHYNVKHPRGRRFTPGELRGHREQWLAICREKPSALTRVERDARVGPLQSMIDELDYNAKVAELYKSPHSLGAPLATRQFHRALAAGAIALLDEELKNAIYVAYAAADAANQHQARAVRGAAHQGLVQRTYVAMLETRPVLCQARDMLLKFASSDE
jgi:hypothetical protein